MFVMDGKKLGPTQYTMGAVPYCGEHTLCPSTPSGGGREAEAVIWRPPLQKRSKIVLFTRHRRGDSPLRGKGESGRRKMQEGKVSPEKGIEYCVHGVRLYSGVLSLQT